MKKTNDTPFRDILTNDYEKANCVLLGITDDSHASISYGAKEAPDRLRELSRYLPPVTKNRDVLREALLFDHGNTDDATVVQEKVNSALADNKFLLIFGGDHAISIRPQQLFIEHAKKQGKIPLILHFDAHADICDCYQGDHHSHACVNRRAIDNGLKPENLVMFGVRSYEVQEVDYLEDNPEVTIFDPIDFDREYRRVMESMLGKYDSEQHLVYISIDIDVFDPAFAPGTGTPEAFGVSPEVVRNFLSVMFRQFNVVACDLVEISPQLDQNNITSWLGLKLIYEIFGFVQRRVYAGHVRKLLKEANARKKEKK